MDRQACAAVGQGALMAFYDGLFDRLGLRCAQVLLTEEDFHFRQRFNNLTATLERLLELGAVPVLNENDTLSTAELALAKGAVFGDNDRLSALVATYLRADALVLLSDVDGVYTPAPGGPGSGADPHVDDATTFEEAPARPWAGAAWARRSRRPSSRPERAWPPSSPGAGQGRPRRGAGRRGRGHLLPAHLRAARRKAWLAFGTAPSGAVRVNGGARDALVERGASLLAVGVVAVEGDFAADEVIRVFHGDHEIARGVVTLDASALRGRLDAPPPERARPHPPRRPRPALRPP